jgi:3-phosphoshikimate 1-carboxyvinyltransferase
MDKFAGPFEVPSGRPARGRVVAPPSKSHAIRALVCAHLVRRPPTIARLPDALDVAAAEGALAGLRLGVSELDLAGSATAFRFCCAAAALRDSRTTLTGDESLRRRPMDAIVAAVRQLGAAVDATAGPGGEFAPVVVNGPAWRSRAEVDASGSSHALSALLLVGPRIGVDFELKAVGAVASRPYVDLTLWTMRQFGVEVAADGGVWRVPHAEYVRPAWRVTVVGDWSSAAFLMGAAAASGGDVTIDGLEYDSPQADRRVAELLREFGATVERIDGGLRVVGRDRLPLDVDLKDSPDLAPLVGALGCVASGTTRVRGAAHLRIKESDRIAAVVAAARALGCDARELPDGFEIDGPAQHGGLVETRHDHRIAMAFAVAGLAIPGVVIDDPACVAKSYPGFWDDLARLTSG